MTMNYGHITFVLNVPQGNPNSTWHCDPEERR